MARAVAVLIFVAMICATYAFPKDGINGQCGPNEVFTTCGTACESTCQHPNPLPCAFICKIGCECQKGFLRSHPGGECVPRAQCLLRD